MLGTLGCKELNLNSFFPWIITQVFRGNQDRNTIVYNILNPPITTRFIPNQTGGVEKLHIHEDGDLRVSRYLNLKRSLFRSLSPVQTDATLLANNSQHCWMLHVASVCTPCCMLLDVFVCCCAKFETSQTFQPTNPNISFVPWSLKRSAAMLYPFAQLVQHCWGRARSLRMVYKDLRVVSFPRCTAGSNIVGATMLEVVASVCTQPYLEHLNPLDVTRFILHRVL